MTISGLLLFAVSVLAQAQPGGAPRERPSKYLTCPRDHLTNYSGLVTEYRRERGRTTLTIRTDWETTEQVELKHPGTDDPSRWFLLQGRPFTPDDWKEIEIERDRLHPQLGPQLKPKMRASAWVCDDGTNAIVDWNRPPEKG